MLLHNGGTQPVEVVAGQAIAQLLLECVNSAPATEVTSVTDWHDTIRNNVTAGEQFRQRHGFGSGLGPSERK